MPRARRYSLPSTGDMVTAGKVKKLPEGQQIDVMRAWFESQFDPPDELPYDSSEGGYQWIWGGPFEPLDELQAEFESIASQEAIETLASELSDISWTWSGKPDDRDRYYDDIRRWVPEHIRDPYMVLTATLAQIEDTAKRHRAKTDDGIVYRLLFANVITALETYLGDAFAAIIFKRRDLFERFVHNSSYFQNQKINLNEIFTRVQTLEAEVRSLISRNLWHQLQDAEKLYRQAFGIKLPEPSQILRDGIRDRHD